MEIDRQEGGDVEGEIEETVTFNQKEGKMQSPPLVGVALGFLGTPDCSY